MQKGCSGFSREYWCKPITGVYCVWQLLVRRQYITPFSSQNVFFSDNLCKKCDHKTSCQIVLHLFSPEILLTDSRKGIECRWLRFFSPLINAWTRFIGQTSEGTINRLKCLFFYHKAHNLVEELRFLSAVQGRVWQCLGKVWILCWSTR